MSNPYLAHGSTTSLVNTARDGANSLNTQGSDLSRQSDSIPVAALEAALAQTSAPCVARFLAHYLKPYLLVLFLGSVAVCISTLTAACLPWCIGLCIDSIFASNGQSQSLWYLGLSLVILLVSAATNALAIALLSRASSRASQDIRRVCFSRIKQIQASYLSSSSFVHDIHNRCTADNAQIADGIYQLIYNVLTSALTICCVFVMMSRLSLLLACVVGVAMIFALALQAKIASASENYFLKTENFRAQLSSFMDDTLENQELLRLAGTYHARREKLQGLLDGFYASGIRAQFISSLSNPTSRLVNNLLLAATVGVCAYMVILVPEYSLSIGAIVSAIAYVQQITKPINELSGLSTQLEAFYISAKRLTSYLALTEKAHNTLTLPKDELQHSSLTDKLDAYIQVSGLYVGYEPAHPVLKHLNLSLKKGETLALVGPSGCGKSTLMQTIVGLLAPDQGAVYLDGKDLRNYSQKEISEYMSLVMQSSCVLNASIRENITYGTPGARTKDVEQVIKDVGLEGAISALPQGIDTMLSRKHPLLSLGEIQLISIARAFIQNKPILLLDEATASLDPKSEKRITQALERLMQGRSVICVAHRLSTIVHADRICVMRAGTIQEMGSHAELMAKKGFYYELFSAQKLESDEA